MSGRPGSRRRGARADPADADAPYWLGEAQLSLGKSDAAADSYRRVLRIRPHHAESLYRLGYLLAAHGSQRRDDPLQEFGVVLVGVQIAS